jgi:hypothetical protein
LGDAASFLIKFRQESYNTLSLYIFLL